MNPSSGGYACRHGRPARQAGVHLEGRVLHFPLEGGPPLLTLVEEIETEFHARLETQVMAAPHEAVRMLLRSALTARDEHPSARLAIAEEVIGVLRATTPEKQEAFLDRGVDMVSEIMKPLSAQGVQVRVEPIVLAGLLRALAFIGLHSEDVGPKIAPKVQDLLIESLARALVPSARSR